MKKTFRCRRGNLTICGCEYREKTGKLPAVILCHGFMANQSMCKNYAKLCADRGFAAFTFDFNGGGLHSKSSGKSIDMTVVTEMKDLMTVIRFLKSRDDIDSDRIILMGFSQGGLVCALAARYLKEQIAGLILLYPALCIPDDARAGKMMFAKFDPMDIPPILCHFPMKLGGCYAEAVIDWDVYERIEGFQGKVLLIHGTKDEIVDITYARKAVNVYKTLEYHEIEGGTHGFYGRHDEEAKGYITEFLETYSG